MRTAVYGAGAIGGYLAAVLSRSGVDVTLIARGANLEAIRGGGLVVVEGGDRYVAHPRGVDDPAAAGVQDVVIVALKAPAFPGVVEAIQPLLGPDTAVVTAMNGIPYWYFHRHGGALEGHHLESVDPGGRLWDEIGPHRAIGCVVHPATEVIAPGVIEHVSGTRFSLGEPGGEKSERVGAISSMLEAAGLAAPIRGHIRNEIWVKLWGNLSFNPISALTTGTLEEIAGDPGTRQVVTTMMNEAREVAERLGIRFGMDVDRRIEGAAGVGAHKTSMLQDLERGKTVELDALVGSVMELGALVGVPTPTIDMVFALVRQRALLAGCYTPT
jgi:2-dehydropantoate 2-reductase